MLQQVRCIGAVLVLAPGGGVAASENRGDVYAQQIRKATALAHRGLASKQEIARARAEMEALGREKDAVTEHIIARMVEGDPKRLFDPDHVGATHYGMVLSHFGSEYACRLEPKVLDHARPLVRRAGLQILGATMPRKGPAVDLVVKVLKRDKAGLS